MYYVACDIEGRLSADRPTLLEVMEWMEQENPNGGDCVVWEKPRKPWTAESQPRIAAIRHKGKWKVSASS